VLPIYEVESEFLAAMEEQGRAVLSAPTGSGKTTQVPQILHKSGLVDGQIVVLQPRRLATRMVATRVAEEMGCRIGEMVGYQVRHDSRIGPDTEIRFMTYGLFITLLRNDPGLSGIGTVLHDEFHERNLDADVALALACRLQETSRPDLKIVVMSATLDSGLLAGFMDCPVIESDFRSHPVEIRYLSSDEPRPVWELAAEAIRKLLRGEEPGDVLVFMPGMYEIRRTLERCLEMKGTDAVSFLPLHGELPAEAQDRAVARSSCRKVIVSTNVAETSLTIEGVRHVIDGGLARIQRFDPRRGINMLTVQKVSVSSADQRAGRAGRTAPGTCLRLWSRQDHRGRRSHEVPEIRRLDLAHVVLQLKSMGVAELSRFRWLEPPDPAALERASSLLVGLEAIDAGLDLTDTGRRMSRLPMHPRLSRMVVEAAAPDCLSGACLFAALLSERSILARQATTSFFDTLDREFDSDFELLEEAMEFAQRAKFDNRRCLDVGLNSGACRQVERTFRLYLRISRNEFKVGRSRLKEGVESWSGEGLGRCLLVAFFDLVAAKRTPASEVFDMTGGRRGKLARDSVAAGAGLVVAAEATELPGRGRMTTVLSLATSIAPAMLMDLFPDRMSLREDTVWNEGQSAVESVEQWLYHDLAVQERRSVPTDTGRAAAILADQLVAGNIELKRWTRKVDEWIDRVRCVAEWFPEKGLVAYDEDDLRLVFQEICAGATRFSQVRDRPCYDIVRNVLSWQDLRFVEEMAPERIRLPRGFRMRVQYPDRPGERPRARAKIQDFYDLRETPTVGGGRQVLVLEILAPNFRSVQTTDDLAGFWKNHYPQLKKQLARRYPKHEWR